MHSTVVVFISLITGSYPTYSASFGEGRGAILLNQLACLGNETRLVDCQSTSTSQCTHSEDAGVRCLLQTSMLDMSGLEEKLKYKNEHVQWTFYHHTNNF